MKETLSLDGLPDLPPVTSLTRLAPVLWAEPDVRALWLGGSLARGKGDAYSDVDLRVAVAPDSLEAWRRPDLERLFAGECVGSHFVTFGEAFLHHLLLSDGTIVDLWVQSVTQPPPQDATLVLGCRDADLARRLAEARLPADAGPPPADPQILRQALVDFWIGSHKHAKVLHRGLDLMVTKGMDAERMTLLRLWHARATGCDAGAQAMTIHSLTRLVRVANEAVGTRAAELIGAPLSDRAQVIRTVEANRDEVAHVGRDLAAALGFAYPGALERTVRHTWRQFRDVL